jgi:hypothetical protein
MYNYPLFGGFQLDTTGNPIIANVTLEIGTIIDRFGDEFGTYTSPGGAPFSQRSLPPSQLNAPRGVQYPYNYHVYTVLRPIVVKAGPIAAWFAQPGYGVQFKMPNQIFALVDQGYLDRTKLTRASRAQVNGTGPFNSNSHCEIE